MDHILKNCYLGFFRYLLFRETTVWTLSCIIVSIPLRGIWLPKPNTYSDWQGGYSKRKALKCPGSRTSGLLREGPKR